MGTNEAPITVTPEMVYDIVREASLVHFETYCPGTAHKMADRLAAGVSSGYRRATLTQRDDWTKLGADSLRAAAVMIAIYGLNPDPGARELYIFPRGGQLVVSPTPEGVRTMLANAGYMIDVYLCGPHDADGIDVRPWTGSPRPPPASVLGSAWSTRKPARPLSTAGCPPPSLSAAASRAAMASRGERPGTKWPSRPASTSP
jgi:hypothetical protein